jgi:hypothetical protein
MWTLEFLCQLLSGVYPDFAVSCDDRHSNHDTIEPIEIEAYVRTTVRCTYKAAVPRNLKCDGECRSQLAKKLSKYLSINILVIYANTKLHSRANSL